MPVTPVLEFDPAAARRHLRRVDPVLAGVMRRAGPFQLRPRVTQSIFGALVESIVYQQLSGKAAATILERTRRLFLPKRFPTPADILATPDERLRSAGLSRAKTAALKDLAEHTLSGTVPTLTRARRMPDEELIERLTAVRGIGVWTVEMLLMFRLGRPDVLPVGDLGVRKGFSLAYGIGRMPTPRELAAHAECWRPFRSVGSWYMWRAIELHTGPTAGRA
ncbi:MAG TPA: DNA-3-methyladenine glycosylase [Gemmatimonadales bacterium]|nr:DNA-3-methyladenine glycosylase [Gemmatimonadales bacterium]